ncbi:DNA/RNA non-specific endonuclease [Streptomyces sp. NBC_01257]|uniref:DNA/RNA non-specific endonuclease n=1 Tax=Streptomyces sp. NBC_01257 TaxID=2903799 RepID=UPI002DDA7E0F|nr:DNA/RNA non-specific endonuclease [Streptomyces sp. NBC_01257]WRZ65045.1 DNA/RNA non-specific endonuclease [Streptomyces sp. NBC_01257]
MHAIRTGRAPRRRARSAVLTGLTALTLVLTTAVTGQAAQPQSSTATTSSATKAAGTSNGTDALATRSGEECTATAPGSKERRAGAVESCVTVAPAPAKAQARVAATAADGNTGSCDITNPGIYSYERFSYCVTGINVTYILRNANGVEIGRGTLAVSTGGDLSPTETTWSEQVTVTMTSAAGDVTALDAKLRASCDAGCTATKTAPWYKSDLVVGGSLTGTVTYSSPQAAGSSSSFLTAYAMYVTSPGATTVDPNASWKNARQIRCDDAVGGTSVAGCAVPSVMAVVPMKATSADAGGAVAAYGWAQSNLNGAWGKKGSPLTRSTSGVAARTATTCGGFTAETELVDGDSCGDFPFGEAKEGGAAGAQCVQAIPHLGNGEWNTYVLNDAHELDRAAPCVQAHVTPAEKQFADTQLVDGFTDQRVIDADQFELPVSVPDAGPQASCLNDPRPINSIPNPIGGGWFWNTTEAVPLANQSKPAAGAGERPTRAQACLGRETSGGKGTSDPVTGWEDAEKFKKDNSLTYGLSRCHLIAKVLGGKGNDALTRSNLVPCWQTGMNTGTPSMRKFETMAQDTIKGPIASFGPNDAVFYQVTPVYKDADSTIPTGVTMIASIQRANGTTEELFPNVYVTNTYANTGTYNLGN